MAKISIKAGTTSKLLDLFISDSSSTTGAGLGSIAYNTSGLTAYYYREGAASATAITLATMTLGTWATGGFIVIDGTNMLGAYQLGIPDAAIAAGAKSCLVYLKGVTNMAPLILEIELTAVDNQSATAFITGVNSLAPPTNWNLESIDANGRVDVIKIAGTTQTARDIGASVLLSAGTGTGQLDFTSGVVKGNVTQWLGTAASTPTVAGVPNVNVKTWNDLVTVALPLVPTTAGRTLDVSVGGEAGLDWANVGSPTTALALTGTTIAVTQKVDVDTIKTNPVVNAGTVTFPTTATLASTTNITAGTITTVTNLTNAPTAGDLTATMKTSVTTAATAATPTVTLTSGERTSVADALLDRDMATGTDSGGRTVRNALRFLRNKWSISGTTLTVTKEDDTTAAWTSTITAAPGADPISGSDPA